MTVYADEFTPHGYLRYSSEWEVSVQDVPKGVVYRHRGRWRWHHPRRGIQQWKPGTRLQHVHADIADILERAPQQVTMTKLCVTKRGE